MPLRGSESRINQKWNILCLYYSYYGSLQGRPTFLRCCRSRLTRLCNVQHVNPDHLLQLAKARVPGFVWVEFSYGSCSMYMIRTIRVLGPACTSILALHLAILHIHMVPVITPKPSPNSVSLPRFAPLTHCPFTIITHICRESTLNLYINSFTTSSPLMVPRFSTSRHSSIHGCRHRLTNSWQSPCRRTWSTRMNIQWRVSCRSLVATHV